MPDAANMRTTLTLDDDVLDAARRIAEIKRVPIGTIISDLARRSLTPPSAPKKRNGILLFPVHPKASPVTPEIVKELLEESE